MEEAPDEREQQHHEWEERQNGIARDGKAERVHVGARHVLERGPGLLTQFEADFAEPAPAAGAKRVLEERLVERHVRSRGSFFRSQCGSRTFAKGHIKIVSELRDLVWSGRVTQVQGREEVGSKKLEVK